MTEKEVVLLDVDVSGAEIVTEGLFETFSMLKALIKDIGKSIAKAFVPLQKSIEKMIEKISVMTDALRTTTTEIKNMVALFAETQIADQWAEEMTDAFNSVCSTIGTIAGVAGTLLTAGVSASTVGIVAVVMAAVAAIIAAIVAIVKHWDEICSAFNVFFTQTLPQLWSQFVEWISGIASKVAEVFSNVMSAIGGFFVNCWNAIVSVFSGIGQWIQDNVIQPIIDYFTPAVEWLSTLFDSIRQTVADVFYNISVIISGCWDVLMAVWGVVAEWFDVNVIQPVADFFVGLWTGISTWAVNAWNDIVSVFTGIANWFYQNIIQPVSGFFSGLWNSFSDAAVQAWEAVKAVFSKVTGFFKDVFTKAWSTVVNVFSTAGEIFTNIKDGILSAFKNIVNGIIKGLNSAICVPFNGINAALGAIRDINILGLTPFSGLRTISVPQIPYLAQGAVLPANRPFLAVVGDQRHGTNVEAPLETIQEAVAVVIDDYVSAMMAGFEALLAEQRATRQAVESIHIGDDALYKAVQRRSRVMSIARGGL